MSLSAKFILLGGNTQSDLEVCRNPSKKFLGRELWDHLREPLKKGCLKPNT